MANLNGFNANNVEPSKGFVPIPGGKYLAHIVASKMKTTKRGDGEYLNLEFEILDGDFKSRKLWTNLNLKNPSQEAVAIAQADLSAICRATGVMEPGDSSELHNLPICLTVVKKKRKDSPDEFENKITKYEKREAISGTPQTATSDAAHGARVEAGAETPPF